MSIRSMTLEMSSETATAIIRELQFIRDSVTAAALPNKLSSLIADISAARRPISLYENLSRTSVMTGPRAAAYMAIDGERNYQKRKYGDRGHEVGGWIIIMEHHLQRAREAWATSVSDDEALEQVRKIAGSGVACMEQHGAPERKE